MKQKLSEWSRRYLAALQRHVKEASRASLQAARGLGHQAVASGLQKLDAAMMHTQALARVVAPHYSAGTKEEMIRRAEFFLVEVMVPIGKTEGKAMETRVQLNQLNQTLRQRTRELAATNRRLKREIVRRRTAEEALQRAGQNSSRLVQHSIQLRPLSDSSPQPPELRT